MFIQHEKSNEGWFLVVLGICSVIASILWLTGVWGPMPDRSRLWLIAYLGIPLGIAFIFFGVRNLRGGVDDSSE